MAVLQKTSVPIERVMMVAEIRPETERRLSSLIGQQVFKEEILGCIRQESKKNKSSGDGSTKAKYELFAGEFRLMSESDETYTVAIVINEALHRLWSLA